jgi:hypothetical protein
VGVLEDNWSWVKKKERKREKEEDAQRGGGSGDVAKCSSERAMRH